MPQLRPSFVIKGLASYLPVIRSMTCRSSGGTVSARYCYAVWLRHLCKLHEARHAGPFRRVAELGPGDSIGTGLAAILSGADVYYAFDAKPHASLERNLVVFEELIDLFRTRAAIPDDEEFPKIIPRLANYAFPAHVLSEQLLARTLDSQRLTSIRARLQGKSGHGNGGCDVRIQYAAPWDRTDVVQPGSVDLIYSQAVLEHVSDPPLAYRTMHAWLQPGGSMSHSIDYRSHGITRDWYGHWTLSAPVWRITKGTRPYLINRLPHSAHAQLMGDAGFTSIQTMRFRDRAMPRRELAAMFSTLEDEDLSTCCAYVQAVKRDGGGQ